MENKTPDFSVFSRILGGRWLLPILAALPEQLRFGELQDALPGISRGVLASQLQELLSYGLIRQTKTPGFPPCVEYTCTPRGRELLEIVAAIP